jgi:hypothetical protein
VDIIDRKKQKIKVGDIVEVTSKNFKTFFLEKMDARGRVIGLVIRVDKGFDTSHAYEWLYYVTLINGENFALYRNEIKVISQGKE